MRCRMSKKMLFLGLALVLAAASSAAAQTTPAAVPVDVKPNACPNPLNLRSNGYLMIAVLGTADLDVNNVDPVSVRVEGVAPKASIINVDKATPYEPFLGKTEPTQCNEDGADGYPDLVLKFRPQQILKALRDQGVDLQRGTPVVLHVTGALRDGTPIEGEDVVVIKGKKPKKPRD